MNGEEVNETYHGFTIDGHRENPTLGDYERWHFRVTYDALKNFRHSVKISRTQAGNISEDDSEISRFLREEGLRQIHGKIDLGLFHEGGESEDVLTSYSEETKSVEWKDEEVRLLILQVLEENRRQDPQRHRLVGFDARGFCGVLDLDDKVYLANAVLLRDEGYVADSPLEQKTIDIGGLYITAGGVRYLEAHLSELDHIKGKLRQLNTKEAPSHTERIIAKEKESPVTANRERERTIILRVMHENERTGAYNTEYQYIAQKTALALDIVEYHIGILKDEGYAVDKSTLGRLAAKLTSRGKRRVVEGFSDVASSGGTHITIGGHSSVGIVNTGRINTMESIQLNVASLAQSGHTEVAEALKELSQAVTESQDLATEQRSEILDSLEELSRQAALGPDLRSKPGVIKSLISGIAATLTTAGGAAEVWSAWGPAISRFFGVG